MKVFGWIGIDLNKKKAQFYFVNLDDEVIDDEIWLCLDHQFPTDGRTWIL